MTQSFKEVAASTLREYLLALQESGLDGLPESLASPSAHLAVQRPAALSSASAEAGAPPNDQKHESLEKIRKSLGDCQRCKLAKGRTNLVFGTGNPRARLVFVGEGPGEGRGPAGQTVRWRGRAGLEPHHHRHGAQAGGGVYL